MVTNTLKLIDEFLTEGGYSPGIDAEALDDEAALVEAAPDLLEALFKLRYAHLPSEWEEAIRLADAAIAKAKP